jgi:thioesterase domain-containing protein
MIRSGQGVFACTPARLPVDGIGQSDRPPGFSHRQGILLVSSFLPLRYAMLPLQSYRRRNDFMGPQAVREQPSLPIHFQLTGIWERLLGVEVNAIDQSFFDLGGHSLLLPQMMEEVQRATGKDVPITAFLKEPTIRHLAQCLLIQTKSDGMFVCVQQGHGKIPFYFFHGDILGGGFYSRRLAHALGKDQPFHVSSPIELGENELPKIEELAASKRRSLQKLQPHGPYILGGFCVGAVVAYEVARQLEAKGEEVRGVLLIEPEIGNAVTRSHLKVVRLAGRRRKAREKVDAFLRGLQKIQRLRGVLHSPLREKTRFVVTNSKKLISRRDDPPATTEPEESPRPVTGDNGRDWLVGAYHWVLTSYVPKRYHGPVTLFLTNDQFEQTPFVLKQWQKAAPQTRVERIPGEHLSCITTHLDTIAEKISAELSRIKMFVGMLVPSLGSHLWMLEL